MMTQTQIHDYVETKANNRREGVYKRKYTPEKLKVGVRLQPEQMEKILQSGLNTSTFLRKAIDAYQI